MQMHVGKAIRLSEILESKSLLLDTTISSCIGAPPGLEDLKKVLQISGELFDGIIVNPGQLEHLAEQLGGKNRAAPLVRVDWTNAYRDKDFCLPVQDVKRVEISHGDDVMNLGGSAAVATLLMGFGDEFEAENIRSISRLIRCSYELSLPVFVDIRPIGTGVSDINFEDSIKLGVSFMLEAGADALIIPHCKQESLKLIGTWSNIPVIVRVDQLLSLTEAENILHLNIAGIIFSENILQDQQWLMSIENLKKMLQIK